MNATLAPTSATLLPAPFTLTDNLAVDVDAVDFEAYCPGCGEDIGLVSAYAATWINLTELDNEVRVVFREHLRYDGGPDCRGE